MIKKIPMTVSLEPSLLEKLKKLARQKRWSVSATIHFLLENQLEEKNSE